MKARPSIADEQHPEHGAGRGRGLGSYLVLTTVVLAVYLLSVGPAALLHEKTTNTRLKKVLEFTYAPVEVIEKTPLEPAVEWWIRLWFRLGSEEIEY